VDHDIATGHERKGERRRQIRLVVGTERELWRVVDRAAQRLSDTKQPVHLASVAEVLDPDPGRRRGWWRCPGQDETGRHPGTEQAHEPVRRQTAPVKLDREVEVARLELRDRPDDACRVDVTFHDPGKPGELNEVVDICPEAVDELACPAQTDERDTGIREPSAKRPERRDRAEHVAENESAKDRDLMDVGEHRGVSI